MRVMLLGNRARWQWLSYLPHEAGHLL